MDNNIPLTFIHLSFQRFPSLLPLFLLCLLSLSFESRGGPVCHPFGDTSCQVHIRSQAAAWERCHAQGEIHSSSPLQTPHLLPCRADSSSFPATATSSSSSGARVGCLGLLSCEPQGSVPATALADGQRQPGAAFQNLLNRAVLWYLLNLYNSVICCQYIFAKETKIRLFFLLPQPMKNLSCVCEETLCVCVCTFRGGKNRVSVNLFSS